MEERAAEKFTTSLSDRHSSQISQTCYFSLDARAKVNSAGIASQHSILQKGLSPVKPLKLAKAMALAFVLGAILSVGSDPKLTNQVQAIALSKTQEIATSAMQKVSSTLGHLLEQGLDAALKEIVKQVLPSG